MLLGGATGRICQPFPHGTAPELPGLAARKGTPLLGLLRYWCLLSLLRLPLGLCCPCCLPCFDCTQRLLLLLHLPSMLLSLLRLCLGWLLLPLLLLLQLLRLSLRLVNAADHEPPTLGLLQTDNIPRLCLDAPDPLCVLHALHQCLDGESSTLVCQLALARVCARRASNTARCLPSPARFRLPAALQPIRAATAAHLEIQAATGALPELKAEGLARGSVAHRHRPAAGLQAQQAKDRPCSRSQPAMELQASRSVGAARL